MIGSLQIQPDKVNESSRLLDGKNRKEVELPVYGAANLPSVNSVSNLQDKDENGDSDHVSKEDGTWKRLMHFAILLAVVVGVLAVMRHASADAAPPNKVRVIELGRTGLEGRAISSFKMELTRVYQTATNTGKDVGDTTGDSESPDDWKYMDSSARDEGVSGENELFDRVKQAKAALEKRGLHNLDTEKKLETEAKSKESEVNSKAKKRDRSKEHANANVDDKSKYEYEPAKNSTMREYVLSVGRSYDGVHEVDHKLASGILEMNADGQGWDFLNLKSAMDPYSGEIPGDSEYRLEVGEDPQSQLSRAELMQNYFSSRLGMGFLEGYTTCEGINFWYENSYQAQFDGGDPNHDILTFLQQNHDWTVAQAEEKWEDSDYWLSVKGRLMQLHGMLAGVRAGCPGTEEDLTIEQMPILPKDNRNKVADFDFGREWRGGARKNKYTYTYEKPTGESKYDDIYLPEMRRRPSLIHLLILNANGDMYQIGDKFDIFAENPVGINPKSAKRSDDSKYMTGPDKYRTDHSRQDNGTYNYPTQVQKFEDDDLLADDDVASHTAPRPTKTRALRGETADNKKDNSNANRSNNSPQSVRGRRRMSLESARHALYSGKGAEKGGDSGLVDEVDIPFTITDHCSALIKILPNFEDVVFGHNTWDDYQNAFPRVFKSMEYPLMKDNIPDGQYLTHFSSSPGLLSSVDDFYIIKNDENHHDHRLAVIETSLDVYNRTYLDFIKPQSILSWIRVMTANELATTGPDWAKVFSNEASGTYIDQWMILDLALFEPGRPPRPGFFTVLEEMPGLIHWEDQTAKLIERSYWASYNNPYYEDIREYSGQTDLCIQNSLKCYDTDPRALIFHELQSQIKSVQDHQTVMDYNRWQTDPLSFKDSCRAIACRGDLEPDITLVSPHGAVDAKVSSANLASSTTNPLVVKTRLGPTHSHQPPFCWWQFEGVIDMSGQPLLKGGHPECFTYDWIDMPRQGLIHL